MEFWAEKSRLSAINDCLILILVSYGQWVYEPQMPHAHTLIVFNVWNEWMNFPSVTFQLESRMKWIIVCFVSKKCHFQCVIHQRGSVSIYWTKFQTFLLKSLRTIRFSFIYIFMCVWCIWCSKIEFFISNSGNDYGKSDSNLFEQFNDGRKECNLFSSTKQMHSN